MGNDAGHNDRPRRTEHTKRRIKHSMGKNGTQPTMKNVTPAVTPWGKNRVKNTETGKHVLIMPGIGYTVDRPLLYWAAQALAANGWFVDRLDLKLTESVEFPEMIACMERVVDEWRKAALEHAAESGEAPQLLVVTKARIARGAAHPGAQPAAIRQAQIGYSRAAAGNCRQPDAANLRR